MKGAAPQSRLATAFLFILYLSTPYVIVLPVPVFAALAISPPGPQKGGTPLPPGTAAGGISPPSPPGGTPLPPGTVTNLAGKTSPSPSCPPKPTEPLAPTSSWSTTLKVPTSLFSGSPSGTTSTQTFVVFTNGTFAASDNSGNHFAIGSTGGLPSGVTSTSLKANSTVALQNFLDRSGNSVAANVTVSYSVRTSFCQPAGLRIELAGKVNWPGGRGVISIPFKSQPAFHPTSANATANNPTVAYFGSTSGITLGLDWSDSKALNPVYDAKTNSIDYQVGSSFFIDPVTVATSTVGATGSDYQGHTCYANGRFWVFYNDGVHLGWVSSADGTTWSSETTITTSATSWTFAFYCSGTTLYYVFAASASGSGAYYRYGTLNPDGTITWAISEGFFQSSSTLVRGMSTVLDSSGKWWAAFGSQVDTLGVEVWLCSTPSTCTWTQSTNFATAANTYVPYADIVPLTAGKMSVTFVSGANVTGSLGIETFSGSSWSGQAFASGTYRLPSSTCVSIGDTVECGVDSSNTAVGYIKANYNSNIPSWSSFTQLATCSSVTNCYASMTTDGVSTLVMTFARALVKLSTTVGYFQSSNSGTSWGPETDFSTTETNPTGINSPFNLGGYIQAVWTSGSSSPFNVRFAQVSNPLPPTPTPPWGQPGLSHYESYTNNGQFYVSQGSGLLTIEQSTFNLAGRGLSVGPALIYQEPPVMKPGGNWPYQTDNFTLADLGHGMSLNLPWLGTYAVHLTDGQQYPYAWSGTDMQVHGPVDFDLTSTSSGGVCPCTLTMPSGVQYSFNSARKLTSEADPLGNTVSFSYGANGYLSTITDTISRQITFGYNANNQLTSMTAPGSRTWAFKYTGIDQMNNMTDPVGRVTKFWWYSYWLVNEVQYPGNQGSQVYVTYGGATVSGGATYVVTSRSVYPTFNTISQSDSISYTFYNGVLTSDSMTEADGASNVQGYVIGTFSPSAGVEKTYQENSARTTFRIVENDFTSNRLTAGEIEDPNGNILAQSSRTYDNWGNAIYNKDNVGQQTWLSYANTNSYNSFGSSGCSTTGFYSNSISSSIHNRVVGTCDFQNGPGGIQPVQQETFYQYNTSGELLEKKVSHSAGWLYTDYTYDAYGNVLSVKDARGNFVYYRYSSTYSAAYLTKTSLVANTQNITAYRAYDSNTGFMTSTIDPNGKTTSFTYDKVGRVLTETFPAVNGISSLEQWSYDDTNSITTITDPDGNPLKQYFDGIGRETKMERWNGTSVYTTTYFTYNWMDKLASVQKPSGSTYSFTYDSIGRPLSKTNPGGTASTSSYDDINNKVTAKDEDGHLKVSMYDWDGRLSAVTQYSTSTQSYTTSYGHDLSGNLISMNNNIGQITSYSYDDLNRLTTMKAPDGNSTSYTYDGVGNLASKTTSNGAAITYTYDAANRLTNVAYPGAVSTAYTYDQDGNTLTVSSTLSGTTTETFTYDTMDRLASTATTVAGSTYTTTYGYDKASNLVSVTYPDAYSVSMTYDAVNRLKKVGSIATFAYNPDNTVAKITYGDGEVQTYTDDNRDRITGISDVSGATNLLSLSYTYDKASNIININTESFAYDNMSRITSSTGGWGTTTYTYDGAGNILGSTTGGTTTVYSKCGYYPNSLSGTIIQCATDKDGNIISKTGGWTYTYDYEDKETVVKLSGTTKQTDVYDGLANRVEKTETDSTIFSYLGVNLLYEKDITSGTSADHVYGDGMQVAKVTGGVTYYYHEDQVGSNRLVTYVNGGTVTTQFSSDYQPFGANYGATGSESFQYTDRMLDPASSLYYFNARVYDPSIMRFTTKDPPPGSQSNLASPTCGGSSHCATTSNPTCTQGAANSNLYAYAADNPLTNTDPTGMQIFTCENICIAIITITIAIVCIIFIVSIEFCVAFAPIITENVDYICTFVCGFFG